MVYVVHGFNVDRPSGHESLFAFAQRLASRTPDAAYVAVTWPGHSWAGPASYPLEGNDADDSAVELARFIDRVHPAGTELSFVTHSLGARVVLGAVRRLAPGRYPLTEVCTMAAAVDDFSVSIPSAYRAEVERAGRVAVLASERDAVLRLAYPLGDFLQSFLFFWKDVPGLALGYHGPRAAPNRPIPANVRHTQIPRAVGAGHGDYLFSGTPNARQARAAAFAAAVVARDAAPEY